MNCCSAPSSSPGTAKRNGRGKLFSPAAARLTRHAHGSGDRYSLWPSGMPHLPDIFGDDGLRATALERHYFRRPRRLPRRLRRPARNEACLAFSCAISISASAGLCACACLCARCSACRVSNSTFACVHCLRAPAHPFHHTACHSPVRFELGPHNGSGIHSIFSVFQLPRYLSAGDSPCDCTVPLGASTVTSRVVMRVNAGPSLLLAIAQYLSSTMMMPAAPMPAVPPPVPPPPTV